MSPAEERAKRFEEGQKKAALHQAAPAMLEALKGLLLHGEGTGKLVALYVPEETLVNARKALHAARGGAV